MREHHRVIVGVAVTGRTQDGNPGRNPGGNPGRPQIVGADRDVDGIARRLSSGGDVIVTGALGSGKSVLCRAVAEHLRRDGTEPALVRAAAPLSTVPFGALLSSGDDRLVRLAAEALGTREGQGRHTPFIVVIDDAQALDPASVDALGRAIYSRQVTAMLALTADPAGRPGPGAPEALTALWLEGDATRYDLRRLDAGDADALIVQFGGAGLDSVTRAALFVRSGGSRMLLHELVRDALSARRERADPLDPARELPSGTRLADVLGAVLAEYTPDERLALAALGRLRGIEFADASRSIEPSVIETLLTRRAVFTDDAAGKGLYANHSLARAAEHLLADGVLDSALDHAAARALAAPDPSSSAPLCRLIAANWHSLRSGVPGREAVDPERRIRILATAARSANGLGRADLASAYVHLARRDGDDPALQIESSRALARQSRFVEAEDELRRRDPALIPAGPLRRMVRWWSTLSAWTPLETTLDDIAGWLAADGVTEPGILCELDVQRAELACLDLDWSAVSRHAETVLAVPAAHTLARVRCAMLSALAACELGRAEEGEATFSAAERANRDPMSPEPVSIVAELTVIVLQAVAALFAGSAPAGIRQRLRAVTLLAAERDDRTALALAGIASGLVLGALAHDPRRTEVELRAALDRFERVEFAVWRPLVAHTRAAALARCGLPTDALRVLAEVDEQLTRQHRIYRYTRLVAESEVAAAAGDLPSAQRAASDAVRERREAAPRAATAPGSAEDAARRIRFGQASGPAPAPSAPRAPGAPLTPVPPPAQPPTDELTEREYEVALLVARHLSNKQIAHELFLSVRTVESHVYSGRGKLGARSRRELGRLVGEAEGLAGRREPGGIHESGSSQRPSGAVESGRSSGTVD